MSAGSTLNPLFLPENWPAGRAPAIWEVERTERGWKAGAFLWVGDEPALQNAWTGGLWWGSTYERDLVDAIRAAIRCAQELEAERDELLDGIAALRDGQDAMLAATGTGEQA